MQPNYRFNAVILEEFKDPNIWLRVAFEISRIAMLVEMIEECNAEIQQQCKDQELVKLCSLPGKCASSEKLFLWELASPSLI